MAATAAAIRATEALAQFALSLPGRKPMAPNAPYAAELLCAGMPDRR
jgi:hypothetical protein